MEYDSLLHDIRGRKGFEDLMRLKRLAGLISSPTFTHLNANIVFLNVPCRMRRRMRNGCSPTV